MRKKLLLILTGWLLLAHAFAQTPANLSGKVIDTSTHLGMKNASILLLHAKDSIMDQFTRSDKDGGFTLKNVDTGKYVLLICYPEYADYVEQLHITPDNKTTLGSITLVEKAHLLETVIVKQQIAAIRFKGDTTEFNADSFRTQPNASVEDLLKKLPGIQVDKDGKITAQGQTVEKVLVDGEEFFGDDPTLVTKNLRADMVDKVQLFDKTSDQAALTGIDDGEKQKTINIKLKEDKKNGYFGKLSAGVGTDQFYNTQGMFNYFKGKRKFAAYGTFANTGHMGLGFEDQMKYGVTGNNVQIMDGGGIMISGSGDDALSSFNGSYNGHGIPVVNSGGIHFDSKWNEDKDFLNLNYKIGGMSVKGSNSTDLQSNLPNGVLYTHTDDHFKKSLFRQKLDAAFEVKLDSMATLKINAGGSLSDNSTYDQYSTASDRGLDKDTVVNRGGRTIDNDGHDKAFTFNAFWAQKFHKKGRALTVNLSEYNKNSDISGYLYSKYDYYEDNEMTNSEVTDQFKTSTSKTNNLDVKATYTEPFSSKSSMVFNYGITSAKSNSDLKSFNKGEEGYTELDDTYSNHYLFDQFAHTGGAAYSYKDKKVQFNAGTNVSAVRYTQTNEYTGDALKRNFVNWNPSARLTYNFSSTNKVSASYYGSTTQPTVTQLQPVQNNSDNQNIYIGNPDLKPSFRNSFNASFWNSKVLNQRYFGFYGGYSMISNPIVTNVTTDLDSGKSVYQYVNLDQNTANYYGNFFYSRKLKFWDMGLGMDMGINGNKYVNFTNKEMNVTHANNYSLGLRLSKYKEKVLDCSLVFRTGYNSNKSTLQSQIDNNYWSYSLHPDLDFFLPAKFQIHTDLDYSYQQPTSSFDARKQTIWNAWIGKKFLKKENLLLKISVNDLLDQNKGFDRNAYNNNISQTYYTTIHRYFMLSLTWDFNKMGGAKKESATGVK
ncbi:outer membrane beta-barrel family protein [Arachidicoccus terrestris]|uniref:outer membrane beta-barrel family protein n=1 Tax=Arachidicoccus terrestris TaxID=2875539 RepID=UPI001CC3A6B9|nr:outer membrane beta-barrel family protein [Arachidicoccus terrestris]UAY55637.1 TonB-dependent receptor [Arachidicoccus terrestris]